MSEQRKNAHPDAATSGQAVEINAGRTFPHLDCITEDTEKRHLLVADILMPGKENAIPTSYLVALTGLKNARELQMRIATERENGSLILSSCRNGGGYFLPDCGDKGVCEIKEFCNTLEARAQNTIRALAAARAVLNGQK